MPSETSSVMVLPINVAPASSSRCTAQAWLVGTGFDRAQSGLPPPVGTPATSNKSLAAKVRPDSGPRGRPSIWMRGPGTKALTSSDIMGSLRSTVGEPLHEQREGHLAQGGSDRPPDPRQPGPAQRNLDGDAAEPRSDRRRWRGRPALRR